MLALRVPMLSSACLPTLNERSCSKWSLNLLPPKQAARSLGASALGRCKRLQSERDNRDIDDDVATTHGHIRENIQYSYTTQS
jgi:hypothetical protein